MSSIHPYWTKVAEDTGFDLSPSQDWSKIDVGTVALMLEWGKPVWSQFQQLIRDMAAGAAQ